MHPFPTCNPLSLSLVILVIEVQDLKHLLKFGLGKVQNLCKQIIQIHKQTKAHLES